MRSVSAMAMGCVLVFASITTGGAGPSTTVVPAEWGPTTEGCRLSVSTDRPSYHPDQPIRLRLVTENTGGKEVHVTHSSLFMVYRFDVRLPDGKPAPLTLEGNRFLSRAAAAQSLDPLRVGRQDTESLPMLNRLYDMTLVGEYTVSVYRQVWPPGRNQKPVDVASNRVKILIAENDLEK